MKKLLILFSAVITLSLAGGCTKVAIDETGVRINNFGPGKGVVTRDWGPGYRIKLANIHSWHYFPSSVQTLTMSKETRTREPGDRSPLQLRTADGFDILVEITVYYKIAANGAHKLLEDIGSGERYREIVATLADNACHAVFGTMLTEDFYNFGLRRKKIDEARGILSELLAPRNLKVIDIFILDVEFDPKFEQIIKEKKLADQRVLLNRSESKFAAQKGKTDKIAAETEAGIAVIEQKTVAAIDSINAEASREVDSIVAVGNKYATEVRATADLAKTKMTAEATIALKGAEARSKQLITAALAGNGGRNIAAIEAVKSLNLEEVSFSTYGQDWFNVTGMAKRLAGNK